jgi:hypothetical protein
MIIKTPSGHPGGVFVSGLKIVSGGQTGVDRAALDAAMDVGAPHGGWCPLGRRAEDGVIPARYRLKETTGACYQERTGLNVRDSDATLILSPLPLSGGTALTACQAENLGRPCLALDPGETTTHQTSVVAISEWLEANRVSVLNIAGPRASGEPTIHASAHALLVGLLKELGFTRR